MNINQSTGHKKLLHRWLKQLSRFNLLPYIDKIILFGSFARGTARYNSDIDILVLLNDKCSRSVYTVIKNTLVSYQTIISNVSLYELNPQYMLSKQFDNNSLFNTLVKREGKVLWQC